MVNRMPASDSLPTPSLIDRLSNEDLPTDGSDLELEPASGKTGEIKVRRKASNAQRRDAINRHKDSVKRDLEWLLNTRQVVDDRLPFYPEISRSVYAYGLPDITSINVGAIHDQNELLRRMERCIEFFDKRLTKTEITLEPMVRLNRVLRFRISGLILMDPAPEEVVIDTILDPASGAYEVK
jgi:type VI secretion system protein ImpF